MAKQLRSCVTGLILAGGRGSRMGGADKGLLPFAGRPLIDAIVERLAPQVDRIIISANRNLDVYRALGCEVVSDDNPDAFAGPLAGLRAGLARCATPWLAVVPCDAPRFPDDLVARLHTAAITGDSRLVHAATAVRDHPVFMLCRRELLAPLDAWLESGGRKVGDWLRSVGSGTVLFDDETAFANLNTADDLKASR